MVDEIFTEPEETTDDWVDVRMTNPDVGEWDIDLVVVDGRVSYVDLRIQPELLTGFIDCLVDDLDEEQAGNVLRQVAERNGIDISTRTGGR